MYIKENFRITLLMIFLSASAFAQGYKLTPAGGNFTVTFPGADKPTEKTDTTNNGSPASPYTTHTFVQREGAILALAGWTDYNPSFVFGVQAELEANRDNFLKGVKGKLISSKPIKLGEYQGLEFEGETDQGMSTWSRVYIVGKRPYMVIGLSSTPAGKATIFKFFDSFQLTR